MTTPHDYFGGMKLDEQRKQYQATLDFAPGQKVSVAIDWAGMAPAEALKRSQYICERVRVREPDYRSAIARKLMPLYNDNWRDGEVIDLDEFARRIFLAEIRASPADFGSPGCAILYYADGDLLAGHLIEVFLDADFNYVKSQITG